MNLRRRVLWISIGCLTGVLGFSALWLWLLIPPAERIEQHYAEAISFLRARASGECDDTVGEASRIYSAPEILNVSFQSGTNETTCIKPCNEKASGHGPLGRKVQIGSITRYDGSYSLAIVYEDFAKYKQGESRAFMIFFDPLKLKKALSDK